MYQMILKKIITKKEDIETRAKKAVSLLKKMSIDFSGACILEGTLGLNDLYGIIHDAHIDWHELFGIESMDIYAIENKKVLVVEFTGP